MLAGCLVITRGVDVAVVLIEITRSNLLAGAGSKQISSLARAVVRVHARVGAVAMPSTFHAVGR